MRNNKNKASSGVSAPNWPKTQKPGWQTSRHIAKTFWMVAGAYWKSKEKWPAIGLLAAVVFAICMRVLTVVILNSTNGKFFNSLQNKDQTAFYQNSAFVAILLSIQLTMVVAAAFCSQMLEIRWRLWLTDSYITKWLQNQAYYRMRFDGRVDNPDQRISEDVRLLISNTLTLTTGFLNTFLSVAAFASILYGLSGPLTIPLFGMQIHVSGFLLWSALIYWFVGAGIGYRIGNPLIWLNNRQQRLEADYRFALIRVREKAEAIALYKGEQSEHSVASSLFRSVNRNSVQILFRSTKLLTFQTFMTDAPSPLSFILCAPRFFAGAIPLGDMMRSANGFGQMSISLSWVVSAYPAFADWHATVDRLAEFKRDLEEIEGSQDGFERLESKDDSIEMKNLSVLVPNGQTMFSDVSIRLPRGESVLVRGVSGAGKSTLFRVIAGIWPFGSGSVSVPANVRTMLLPQQPFIPIGFLRDALWFPAEQKDGRDPEAVKALEAVDLGHLSGRLGEEAHWEQILSVGEQQRLALAQAILSKPDWLFLDEATSALDPAKEEFVYASLRKMLPATTLVSIGHRDSIESFHAKSLQFPAETHEAV